MNLDRIRSRFGHTVEVADYIIVGSGASGATAARQLARAGFSVIIVEEGPHFPTSTRTADMFNTMRDVLRENGTQVATGRAMFPVLQGRVVGGSTVINSAIVLRLPEDVFDTWKTDYDLGSTIEYSDLERHFNDIEEELSVRAVASDVSGKNNQKMMEGGKALKIKVDPIRRYDKGCRGTARCLQGCPSGGRMSMEQTHIPDALAHGAQLFHSCAVEKVLVKDGRADLVVAKWQKESGRSGRIYFHARRGVVLAASCIQTPVILQKSRIANSSGVVGKHLQCHPGLAMSGIFDEPIRFWEGATQGASCTQFRDEGFKIETIGLPPQLACARLPGAGKQLMDRISELDHMGLWAIQLKAREHGSVRPNPLGGALVQWSLTDWDIQVAQRGLSVLAEIFFAAGAKRVLPFMYGAPTELTSPDQIKLLSESKHKASDFTGILTHLMGTVRMGADPRRAAVSPTFETHDVKGLYVTDSSVFPTNLGVNPQHTIMAMTRHACEIMTS